MLNRLMGSILCMLLVFSFISCEKEPLVEENFAEVSKNICYEFLMDFYNTSEEDILNYEINWTAYINHSVEFNYMDYLNGLYPGILSEEARIKLITDRQIEFMSMFAYNSDTSFSVEDLELRVFNDDDKNDIVYAFIVTIKDGKSGVLHESEGQVRIEKINGLNLITATKLYDYKLFNLYYEY